MRVDVNFLPKNPGTSAPRYETPRAAGFDLHLDIAGAITLQPMQRATLPTGLYMAIPEGFELQIRPRSGRAHKHGLTVLNSPGTIDGDYRGEIGVILINLGSEPITLEPNDRAAQGVVCPVKQAVFNFVDTLDMTERGTGGFGSTGV